MQIIPGERIGKTAKLMVGCAAVIFDGKRTLHDWSLKRPQSAVQCDGAVVGACFINSFEG
jgi:hypothetical protein